MNLPIILAHGALGVWDEIIFVSVAAIFLTMMGISWVKSRNSTPPLDTPLSTTPEPDSTAETNETRFRLE